MLKLAQSRRVCGSKSLEVKGRQIEAFLKGPSAKLRLALFYGPDLGLARERADMVARKVEVVQAAVDRWRVLPDAAEPISLLAALGGGEFAVLTGVVLGAAQAGAAIVLDGLAASVPALLACRLQPSVQGYLVAGQASREVGHQQVLQALGLEPLLHLRLRCGEGVGACLAASMLLQGERMRALTARTC